MTFAAAKERASLHALADAYGLKRSYVDNVGKRQRASTESILAVLHALGAPVTKVGDAKRALAHVKDARARRWLEPVLLGRPGRKLTAPVNTPSGRRSRVVYRLTMESGETREGWLETSGGAVARNGVAHRRPRVTIADKLPLGYHDLTVSAGDDAQKTTIIVAPPTCRPIAGEDRANRWGAFLPLYAFRKTGGWGVGDYTDLGAMFTWLNEYGADLVGTLPLLAAFLEENACDPSPYSPVSRSFWNELYVDVTRPPEWRRCKEVRARAARAEFKKALQQLQARDEVDHQAVMAQKRACLEPMADACFDDPARRGELEVYLNERPELRDYAQFRAACERHGVPWWDWPARMCDGKLKPGDYDEGAYRYRVYAQWLADTQLAEVAAMAPGSGRGIYMDLPIGVNRAGYDTWRERDAFVMDLSAGAPPDAFFTLGQKWGLPPLHPQGMREQGYRYLRKCLRHNLRHAGILRVDHIMGFHRVFCVPEGMEATDGLYIRYPADELYAVLTLESGKRDCAVVGEDLGTVPPEVRRAMDKRNINRSYVAQFSFDGKRLAKPPGNSAASINTHDTPTFAAFYRGADIADRVDLGLMSPDVAKEEEARRARMREAFERFLRQKGLLTVKRASTQHVLQAVLKFLAQSPAEFMLVNLEDLWLEEQPQNVPGTSWERPNWRRKAARTFAQLQEDATVRRLLREVNRSRNEARAS